MRQAAGGSYSRTCILDISLCSTSRAVSGSRSAHSGSTAPGSGASTASRGRTGTPEALQSASQQAHKHGPRHARQAPCVTGGRALSVGHVAQAARGPGGRPTELKGGAPARPQARRMPSLPCASVSRARATASSAARPASATSRSRKSRAGADGHVADACGAALVLPAGQDTQRRTLPRFGAPWAHPYLCPARDAGSPASSASSCLPPLRPEHNAAQSNRDAHTRPGQRTLPHPPAGAST